MWIWSVGRSEGGNPTAIAKRAWANGIKTLFIKSGDGTSYWSQFSRRLVYFIHRYGVHVCAWQYVYGTSPLREAEIGVQAVRRGADCLVIDAEVEYQGRYAQAQQYVDALRAAVGARYPLGLASFPFVDYHPGFPYSVFLGHGGATVNLPQMYWHDIGESVAAVYRHTYMVNRIYRRAIRPLGQTDSASAGEISLFRGLSLAYGAGGLSWWDYAWTSANGLWPAVSGPYTSVAAVPSPGFPLLHDGSQGDMVLWMQELLKSAIPSQRTTGTFASETLRNLRRFQARRGIPATGQTGPLTWLALLRLPVARVHWAADARAASGRAGRYPRTPQSASLPALADEIHNTSGPDGARASTGRRTNRQGALWTRSHAHPCLQARTARPIIATTRACLAGVGHQRAKADRQ
jgi:peptidoglycan hydrolase-like protein with peptidoglycan-binding domain